MSEANFFSYSKLLLLLHPPALVVRSSFLTQVSGLKYQVSPHSHSIVLGGFELMSYTTRFTPRTSLMILEEIFSMVS